MARSALKRKCFDLSLTVDFSEGEDVNMCVCVFLPVVFCRRRGHAIITRGEAAPVGPACLEKISTKKNPG